MRRNLLKIISLAICSVLLVGVVAACKRTEYIDAGDDFDASLNVDYNTSANLKVAFYLFPESDEKHFEELEKAFQLRYKNVTISTVVYSDDTYAQNLMQAYQSHNMPDIIMTNATKSFQLIESNLLLNLSPFVKLENEEYVANKEEAPDFYPYDNYEKQFMESMWKLGQQNYSGNQYFIPRSADRIVTYYNKAQFEAAGVDMLTVKNGWTWYDFLAACEKLKIYYEANFNSKPFMSGQWQWEAVLFPILESCGGKVFDEDGNIILNSEQTKRAIDLVRGLIDNQYTTDKLPNMTQFYERQAAIQFQSLSPDTFIDKLGNDLGIVTFPLIDDGNGNYDNAKIGAGVAGYGIFSGISEKKRDLAWQFLSFMLSKEGQECMAKAGVNAPPMRLDMQDGSNLWRKNTGGYNMDAFLWEPERNHFTDFYLGQKGSLQVDLLDTLIKMFNDRLMPSPKTTEQSILDCQATINNIIHSGN